MYYLMYTGNISGSDEMEKIIQERWLKVFLRYFSKGDYLFLTFWDDEVSYLPTPHLDALKNYAEKNTVNEFKQNVMKIPASNEVKDIIIDGVFTFRQVLISYFHMDITTSEGKIIFSSGDNGSSVMLNITEEDKAFIKENSIDEYLTKLKTPFDKQDNYLN